MPVFIFLISGLVAYPTHLAGQLIGSTAVTKGVLQMNKLIVLFLTFALGVVYAKATDMHFVQAPVSAILEDRGEGILLLGDQKIKLTFAAGAINTSFGKNRALIYLSNGVIDPFGSELAGQIERGERHLVEIHIDEKGDVLGFNLGSDINKSGALMGLNAAPLTFKPELLKGDRLSGKVFNTEPVLMSVADRKIEIKIDARFSTALLKIGANRSKQKEGNSFQPVAKKKNRASKPIWKNAKAAMDRALKAAGSEAQPLTINFMAIGEERLTFNYYASATDKTLKQIYISGDRLDRPRVHDPMGQHCPPLALENVNFDIVSKIFSDMQKRTDRGWSIAVNLCRWPPTNCKETVWQAAATYLYEYLIVIYSIDGNIIDIQKGTAQKGSS
ncbi:MAG: hypothetical protein CSA33_02290 [Desulfobulbus propionicus]|nr:MAG: hypothetical protein CSA33_02290 [Desulfobulbus propionicus]